MVNRGKIAPYVFTQFLQITEFGEEHRRRSKTKRIKTHRLARYFSRLCATFGQTRAICKQRKGRDNRNSR